MDRKLRIARKAALCLAARAALSPLKLLPIKKDRVLFTSYLEKQYSCSPRYISQELKRLYGDRIEIGWAFRNPAEFAYLKDEGITVLDAKSREFLLFAMTAKVICTNTYYKPSLPRRRKQFFLRTWHGGGAYKKVGRAQDMPLIERLFISLQQQGADVYLSSSKEFTKSTLRESFNYKGEVLEIGLPRNDMLINGADASAIRAVLGLEDGERLVLYAPTYRADTQAHSFDFDAEAVTKALEARFGGTWKAGFRGHHVTMFKKQEAVDAMDLTKYPDMQELLLAADCLITDYSSSIWDWSLTGKPAFLYCTDLDEYKSGRDFYTDISTWPYEVSRNTPELVSNIENFSEEKMKDKIKQHHERLGITESGHASEICARRIAKVCGLEE